MVRTRKGNTYETPPTQPSLPRSLDEEVAEADAVPQGELDSDSYWSGSEFSNNAVGESSAVASSEGTANVLSGDSTIGCSSSSPEALSISSAGGRIIEPDFSQSIAPVLHNAANSHTVLVLMPSKVLGSSSLETGTFGGVQMASTPASVAANIKPLGADTVTAADDRRVVVAGTSSIQPSLGPSAEDNYHVLGNIVNQFVSPTGKQLARRASFSVNDDANSATFFPLWFGQSIGTGEASTQSPETVEATSTSSSDFDRESSGQVVLYDPNRPHILTCAVVVNMECLDTDKPGHQSKKAGKRRQKSASGSHRSRSSKKASGSGQPAPKAPGNHGQT
ncbi:hypothetical protein B0H16DRAFT_1729879 [Mycena metata]|uniref:Uncharacterized protein n=1 Tax=Mycena metata TaxID=1033252 RepID=A0AAD7IAD1_9AGAR|nr:hypothetical protein B0H16DRAFT_1729879 [Mycena metata]